MNPYTNTCLFCNSPARKNEDSLICSNVKCKSWRSIRKASANFDYSKIKQEQGLTSDDPIIIKCPKCNNAASTTEPRRDKSFCYSCSYWFPFTDHIKNHWYLSKTLMNIYITKYGSDNYWDWQTEIKKPI